MHINKFPESPTIRNTRTGTYFSGNQLPAQMVDATLSARNSVLRENPHLAIAH